MLLFLFCFFNLMAYNANSPFLSLLLRRGKEFKVHFLILQDVSMFIVKIKHTKEI